MRIWGLFVLSAFGSCGALSAGEAGFVDLFNGRDLTGWMEVGRQGRGYIVENGTIVCPADGGGKLFTKREYANFVLRFEFRMGPDGNNGIGIRAPRDGHTATRGMEIQILDHRGPLYSKANLKPEQLHGSIYSVVPAKTGFLREPWAWNEQEIVADGRRIVVRLNGETILDADLDEVRDPEILKKHPGLQRKSGHLGMLGHQSHIEFRNIRIKELP
jgi:hypothetical protein